MIDRQVVVINAIEQEIIRLLACPVDRDRSALCLVLRAFDTVVHARDQRHELERITSIQGQSRDFLIVDDVPDRGRIRADHGRGGFDGRGLRDLADREREILAQALVDFKNDVLPGLRLKSGVLGRDAERSDRQLRKEVLAHAVGILFL